jgi:hypothetical protein
VMLMELPCTSKSKPNWRGSDGLSEGSEQNKSLSHKCGASDQSAALAEKRLLKDHLRQNARHQE